MVRLERPTSTKGAANLPTCVNMEAPFISVGLSNRYQKVPLALGKIPGEEDRDFQAWSPSTGWGTGTIPGFQSVLIKVFPVVWKIKKMVLKPFYQTK